DNTRVARIRAALVRLEVWQCIAEGLSIIGPNKRLTAFRSILVRRGWGMLGSNFGRVLHIVLNIALANLGRVLHVVMDIALTGLGCALYNVVNITLASLGRLLHIIGNIVLANFGRDVVHTVMNAISLFLFHCGDDTLKPGFLAIMKPVARHV